MPLKIGTTNIGTVYHGESPIAAVYKGTTLLYESQKKYELLFSLDVTTAATQIDIPNLNITKDDEVRLVFTAVGSSTSTHRLRVFPNDLTTNTNYYTQRLLGTGSTTYAARTNENNIAFFRSNIKVSGFADIKVSENSRFVMQSQAVSAVGSQSSSLENENQNTVGTQTVSSITKLSLICDVTNGIAPGSKIALYKVSGGTA